LIDLDQGGACMIQSLDRDLWGRRAKEILRPMKI
jgi:hypothetical protein